MKTALFWVIRQRVIIIIIIIIIIIRSDVSGERFVPIVKGQEYNLIIIIRFRRFGVRIVPIAKGQESIIIIIIIIIRYRRFGERIVPIVKGQESKQSRIAPASNSCYFESPSYSTCDVELSAIVQPLL